MDPMTERRLRDADPLARRTPDESGDQDWLRETALSVTTHPPRSRRPRAFVIAAAAAVVVAATAGGFLLRDSGDADGGATVAAPTVTDLTVGPEDTMSMCVAFSVEALAPMPVAFSG